MKNQHLSITTIAITVYLSIGSTNAAIIDNGIYTTDTASGLDWLDLTESNGISYNNIIASSAFDGWRHATGDEVTAFFGEFGASLPFSGWDIHNNYVYQDIAPLWGDLGSTLDPTHTIPVGGGYSYFIQADTLMPNTHTLGIIMDDHDDGRSELADYIHLTDMLNWDDTQANASYSHALVRSTDNVPEPTTFALLSMGLLGAMRLNRRKSAC